MYSMNVSQCVLLDTLKSSYPLFRIDALKKASVLSKVVNFEGYLGNNLESIR